MNKIQRLEKIENAIRNEAQEKADELLSEAKRRMEREKNKIYNIQKDKLEMSYKKKEEDRETNSKLHRSKLVNESRLEIQKTRNDLLENLKNDLFEEMKNLVKNKEKYNPFLRNLIFQGMVRLLEKEIKIKVNQEDIEYLEKEISSIEDEFKKYIKEKTGNELNTKLIIIKDNFLNEKEIGGVIMYCNQNKIVFKNTLDVRNEICFEESIPDLRNILFPNIFK